MTVQNFDWPLMRIAPSPRGASARGEWLAITAVLLIVAVFLRGWEFGNPIKGLDEQYYLLVGDRMWAGALPYVDLWDRKPFGLFALFAGVRLLGGDGVVQAQVVATLFAAATALIVTHIARRSAARTPAILGGVTYLIGLHMLWGGNTQTPVFYNLFIAGAAWLLLDTAPALDRRRDLVRAIVAMLLAGLAIQIKTTALFEGGFLGLWLIGRMIGARNPSPRWFITASLLALIALLPTLAVMIGYGAIGHFPEWWFANVQSQFLKHGAPGPALLRLRETAGLSAPILMLIGFGLWQMTGRTIKRLNRWPTDAVFLAGWATACVVGTLAIGGYWAHYALPLVVPASILGAQAFAMPRWGRLGFALFAFYPVIDATALDYIASKDERAHVAATLAAIPDDVTRRCLFIYQGPVIYYHLKHACLVTRFAFSDHLRSAAEADALGENAATALRAALARRPGTILDVAGSTWKEPNRTNDAILAADLRRHYTAIARRPQEHYLTGREWLVVWRRNDLLTPGELRKFG